MKNGSVMIGGSSAFCGQTESPTTRLAEVSGRVPSLLDRSHTVAEDADDVMIGSVKQSALLRMLSPSPPGSPSLEANVVGVAGSCSAPVLTQSERWRSRAIEVKTSSSAKRKVWRKRYTECYGCWRHMVVQT